MKHKTLLLLAAAATLLLTAATATALAAGHHWVPPNHYVAPAWVAPDDAAAYVEGYRNDYEAYLQAEKTGSLTRAAANDPGEPMLVFVAPEDRDEAIARVMKGEDVRFVQRPDGLQAIAR